MAPAGAGLGSLGDTPTTGKEAVADGRVFRRQGLVRPRQGRNIAGVCAGLGRRFGLSPWTARILFILVLLVIPGSQIIVYPILWVLMPSE
jgi:phage shock protein C